MSMCLAKLKCVRTLSRVTVLRERRYYTHTHTHTLTHAHTHTHSQRHTLNQAVLKFDDSITTNPISCRHPHDANPPPKNPKYTP